MPSQRKLKGSDAVLQVADAKSGRSPAGQDPQKRRQILDGAKRCFLRLGFEAASMNEITAEAGVSKGTIYVYFPNKEELFAALIDRERDTVLGRARYELETADSTAEALRAFGIAVTTLVTSDEVIRAQRMVLAVADRMPQLAARFFAAAPLSGIAVLKAFLDGRVAAGELAVADSEFAAQQFAELCMAGLFRRRLFGNMREPATAEQIAANVGAAVAMFLSYYQAKPGPEGFASPPRLGRQETGF